MKAYVLTPGGEKQEAAPSIGNTLFTEDQLENIVGGYIRVINLTNDVVMVVNEDQEDLMFNVKATRLLAKVKIKEYVAGNVLVCEAGMIE